MKAVLKSMQQQQALAKQQASHMSQLSTLYCSLASIDFVFQDDSSSSSSLEFNKGSPDSFDMIKDNKVNSVSEQYKLIR